MPLNRSKPSSNRNRFSFTSTTSTSSSTTSNPPISRTSTNNSTSNSNPFSTSPTTKTTAIHPHYCPAAYHATQRTPSAEAIELETFDTDEHYWDNVRLNSHLSIDAWKTQSKVAQKAAAHNRRHAATKYSSEDGDASDEGVSDVSSGRGRTQWRRGSRGSVGKEVVVAEEQRCKRAEGWKVRGLSWTVGLSGV